MTDIAETIPLLSADEANNEDGEQTMLRQVTDFEGGSSNPSDFNTVIDDMPNYRPVQPPSYNQLPRTAPTYSHGSSHGTNIQYPQVNSSNHQLQAVITNQPTTGGVQQETDATASYYSTNVRACLVFLFVWSCLTCLLCWPLAITSCCLTGYALRTISRDEDPNALMIGAIITIAISVVVGVPLTAVIVIQAVNGGDICFIFYCV